MLVKDAKAIASISDRNSKMPGSTFAQDAFACKVGSKLAKVKGSVCEACYARRIQKMRPSVNQGWTANYEKAVNLISTNPDKWVDACVFQINRLANKSGEMFHRWFDSGDLDSVKQLKAIVKVAEKTPDIAHWLPTREVKYVLDYLASGGKIPSNLNIRISSPMVDQKPMNIYDRGLNTSTVHTKNNNDSWVKDTWVCPASTQGNNCGDCRACWDKDVPNVSYPKH